MKRKAFANRAVCGPCFRLVRLLPAGSDRGPDPVASRGEGRVHRPQGRRVDRSEDHDPFRPPWNGRRAGRNEESEHRAPSSPHRYRPAALGQADSERREPSSLWRRADGSRTVSAARPTHAAIAAGRRGPHPSHASRLLGEGPCYGREPCRRRSAGIGAGEASPVATRRARVHHFARTTAPMYRQLSWSGSGLRKWASLPRGSTSQTRVTTTFWSTRRSRRWTSRSRTTKTICISAQARRKPP